MAAVLYTTRPSPTAELARRIHEPSFLTGAVPLRSGAQASFYTDKYAFEADPEMLREIAEAMLPLLPGRERLAQEGLRLRSLFTISDLQIASPS